MGRGGWILAMVLTLLWTLLSVGLGLFLGSGSEGVYAFARWIQIDPLSLSWLAETLDVVGLVAQLIVGIIWLIGMATIILVFWLGARAASRLPPPPIEGQVTRRTTGPTPPRR